MNFRCVACFCGVGRRGCVGVVRGAGRRGSVACGVAQHALLCAFMFVLMSFLYFRRILAFSAFVCLCAAVYGVIKNNNEGSLIRVYACQGRSSLCT